MEFSHQKIKHPVLVIDRRCCQFSVHESEDDDNITKMTHIKIIELYIRMRKFGRVNLNWIFALDFWGSLICFCEEIFQLNHCVSNSQLDSSLYFSFSRLPSAKLAKKGFNYHHPFVNEIFFLLFCYLHSIASSHQSEWEINILHISLTRITLSRVYKFIDFHLQIYLSYTSFDIFCVCDGKLHRWQHNGSRTARDSLETQ